MSRGVAYQTVRYDIVKSMLQMTMPWGMETARNVAVNDLGMFLWESILVGTVIGVE